MNGITLKQFQPCGEIRAEIPASKSLLNRALTLAAFSEKTVRLPCGNYAEDTRALLSCLRTLGISVEEQSGVLTVHGMGKAFPNKSATLNVMSAGTAARFLAVALAFCGGEYTFLSSPQMEKRPMEVLTLLEEAGVHITYLKERGHFPFILRSEGISPDALQVDTDVSTQYASAILLAAASFCAPFTLRLTGGRTHGSYIELTLASLTQFGAIWARKADEIYIISKTDPPEEVVIEPDLSGACYFYALALLFSARVFLPRVKRDSLQGDVRFLDLLEERGVVFAQTEEGLTADGSAVNGYPGFNVTMTDFSDQTLLVAVLAAYAGTPSRLSGVGHIRFQECDRMHAVCENLRTLGVQASHDENDVCITPSPVHGGTVTTYGDHRVAMAFALAALKSGGITIDDKDCTKKTFEGYFELLQSITK